jgi:hypothetical protein
MSMRLADYVARMDMRYEYTNVVGKPQARDQLVSIHTPSAIQKSQFFGRIILQWVAGKYGVKLRKVQVA